MIDALLSAKLAACSFDGDRRLLVQRILNALGQPAAMQTRWVQWEGKRAQLCQWGDVVLVGGTVLLAADLEEVGGKAARRGAKAAPAAPAVQGFPCIVDATALGILDYVPREKWPEFHDAATHAAEVFSRPQDRHSPGPFRGRLATIRR